MAHSGSRAIQFVLSVEHEQDIESLDKLRVREILVFIEPIEHEKEVFNVI